MSTITANVARLIDLVNQAKSSDEAKVEAARGVYADALAAAEEKRKDAIAFVEAHLVEVLSTGSWKGDKGQGRAELQNSYGNEFSLWVNLPEGVTINGQSDLPFNPDAEGMTPEAIARATGTKTPEFHERTLQVLNVVDGKTIDIDTQQFSYYL